MRRIGKITVVLLLFVSAFLFVDGASVSETTDSDETNNFLSRTDGKISEECDCGPYGLCFFEGGRKKCKCTPSTIEFEGKCLECDCGKFSKRCFYNTNGTKVCECNPKYIDVDGLCRECDCGDKGLCKYENGRKKCICSPNFVEANGKCQACECGEATDTCNLDSSGKKNCKCLPRYKENNGYCAECYCGLHGSCRFENGLRKCWCDFYYSENNGTCESCSCGEKSSSCYFDERGDKKCKCYIGYGDKLGTCEECRCGYLSSSCTFENGRKRCICKPFAVERSGLCINVLTTTVPTSPRRSTILSSTSQDNKRRSTRTAYSTSNTATDAPKTSTILSSTMQTCHCGENSKSCHYDPQGNRICDCLPGYLENNGYCDECDCGSRGKCIFEYGQKKCICDQFTAEKDGKCADCYCGENSKSCNFNWNGDKICNCTSGYAEVYGFCYECNCGVFARSCSYRENGDKVCSCDFGYTQTNGFCSVICSEDKCMHGKCEVVNSDFKCRCYEGFIGRRCEEKIQTKSNKATLWMVMLLSVAFAIFVLLSGMFCFLTRILNKISKK